VKKYGLMKKSK